MPGERVRGGDAAAAVTAEVAAHGGGGRGGGVAWGSPRGRLWLWSNYGTAPATVTAVPRDRSRSTVGSYALERRHEYRYTRPCMVISYQILARPACMQEQGGGMPVVYHEGSFPSFLG